MTVKDDSTNRKSTDGLSAVRRLLSTVYCLLILLISCTATQPTTLRIALAVFPETFDYMMTNDRFSDIIEHNIFETILSHGYERSLHDVLTDFNYFQTDTLLVMHIKEGIKFSDGTDLVAEDIVESIQRYITTIPDKARFSFDEISIIDDTTLYFYLHRADLSYFDMYYFTLIPVYKALYIRSLSMAQLDTLPIGTGPYYLYSAESDKIVLKKNHHYREYSQMSENPDIVEYYLEPNLHSQYLMLKNNQVDFILDMDYVDYPDASQQPDIKIYKQLTDYYSFMALDIMSPTRPDINLAQNPLRDKRVRQAIAHSIDMRTYVAENLSGQAILLTLPAPIQTVNYPVDLEYYPYDLQAAKKLMQAAGLPNGFTMTLASTQGLYSIWLSDFIQKSLIDININVVIEYHDGVMLYQTLAESPPSSCVVMYSPGTANSELHEFFKKHLDYDKDHHLKENIFNLYNKNIHALLDSLKTLESTYIDPIIKNDLTDKLIDLVYSEIMVLPLMQPYTFVAMRKDIVWNSRKNNIPLIREFSLRLE